MKLSDIIYSVETEFSYAFLKHPPMNSPHEGWAVIKEELDELWEHVRDGTGRSVEAKTEAVQIAAMAIRYIYDLCKEVK